MRNFLVRASVGACVGALVLVSLSTVTGPASAIGSPPPGQSSLAPRVETAPSPAAGSSGLVTRAKGLRAIPRVAAPEARAAARPTAIASAAVSAKTVLRSVNGVSSRDSAVTNFNAEFEPPDQGLCVGNGFVLEAVNSAYSVYSTGGKLLRGPFNVNDLFNEGASEFTSDPRCYFDAVTNTWFATILFINSANNESRVDLAVNTSGDPTNAWAHYQIDTSDDGRLHEPSHPGCPCLGDQPTLGIDSYNVYITTNEFSLLGSEYNGAQVYAVARADLAAGTASAHIAHLANLSVGGAIASSVQPALTTGAANAEYFLSSLDPNGTFDSRLGVWALTNRGVVATGGVPTLTNKVVSSEAYGLPPAAQQKGGTSSLDAGDDRMQQVQFIGGRLWGSLTSAVTIPNDPAERAGAAWFSVSPTLAGDHLASARVLRQGYVIRRGDSVLYPALQADASGRAAMVFTLTGADRYPSAAFANLDSDAAAFGGPRVVAAGTGPYDPAATRWGDYSFATLDPATDTVWGATEYIPPLKSQTVDRRKNWGTRFFNVALS